MTNKFTRQKESITIAADITLPEVADGGRNWIPLDEYKGSINGGNHTISRLRIHKSTNCIGFVAQLKDGGKIENLKFVNAKVMDSGTHSYIGIVAGKCSSGGTITNCLVDETSEVSGFDIVGGIVGQSEGGLNDDSSPALTRISNCQNRAKVSGTSTTANAYVGGIVGFMQYSVVERCSNYGAVSSGNSAGGIAGLLKNSVAMACLNEGSITGKEGVGGIAGKMSYSDNTISELAVIVACGNEGGVSGTKSVGGVVGDKTSGFIYAAWTTDTEEIEANGTIPGTKDGSGKSNSSNDALSGDEAAVNAQVATMNGQITTDYNTQLLDNTNQYVYIGGKDFWTCNYQWAAGNLTYPTLIIPSN